ncbi:hypothetical protein G7Y89_g4433 [Cudoniella acicularis]|uniref:Uncharacterized protein n=1 Tax=Cudoniella acicularis TaxID=354080 RepID=A0A8H4W4P9_9HELO|nr:hypothetical protein G7Y89_g4433 [Cudoniella acicularis]
MVTDVAFHALETIERETLFPMMNKLTMSSVAIAAAFYEVCSVRDFADPDCDGKPGPVWNAQWLCLSMKPQIDLWTTAEYPMSKVPSYAYGTYDPSKDRTVMPD